MSTVWLWVLAVALLVLADLAARTVTGTRSPSTGPPSGPSGSGTRPRRCCSRATPARAGCAGRSATPGSRRPAPTRTGTASGSAPANAGAPADPAAPPPARGPAGRRSHRAHPRATRPGGAAAHPPGRGERAVAAAVRGAQAPAEPARPAARPRRPGGGTRARPGHGVRLAARVRPRRRRPLDRLAGQRPQPQRGGAHLAAGARPAGGPGAGHVAHLRRTRRGRPPARLRDGRRAAARGARGPGR